MEVDSIKSQRRVTVPAFTDRPSFVIGGKANSVPSKWLLAEIGVSQSSMIQYLLPSYLLILAAL